MSPVIKVAQHPFVEADEAADDLDERIVLPLSVEEVRLGDMRREKEGWETMADEERQSRGKGGRERRRGPHRRER